MTEIYDDSTGELIASGIDMGTTPGITATVSAHPREQGVAVSDNVQPQFDTLSIRLGVSDVPVFGEQRPGAAREAYDRLSDACRSGALLIVSDSQRLYTSMLLTGVSAPRAAGSSNALVIELQLQASEQVVGVQVDVPPEILAAALRASGKGKPTTDQAPRDTTPKEQQAGSRSWIRSLRAGSQ